MNYELMMNKCECYESISMMNEWMQWIMNVVERMKNVRMNEWMNEWMRWDEDWFEFPAWEISSNFGRFHWFSLERNKPKVKQTDTLTEPLMLAQLKTEQGRIHGHPSRVPVGRGSDR